MPWWTRPALARDVPKALQLPLLCFWGVHLLGSLVILALHFAGVRHLAPQSLVLSLFGAAVCTGLVVFWSWLILAARAGRGGDPPPLISKP